MITVIVSEKYSIVNSIKLDQQNTCFCKWFCQVEWICI